MMKPAGTPPMANFDNLVKLNGKSVAKICTEFDIEDAVLPLITDQILPHEFLRLLIGDGRVFDAMRFLAHALPKRESVWWACQCARSTFKETITQAAAASIAAAEAWVYQPTEENRAKAAAVVKSLRKIDSNTAWAACAASWSNAPPRPGAPPPPPIPNEMTGRAVTVSLTLSAVALGTTVLQDTLRQFVDRGLELARGRTG
jgi:hypothetical protein